MRAAYKVAATGVAVMLCCATVAFAPFDVATAGSSTNDERTSLESSQTMVGAAAPASSPYAGASNASMYRDGVYRSSAQGKLGQVPVTVTIEKGAVTSILVGQNSEAPAMAEKAQESVIPQILEKQSTEGIDAVAGATLTSEAIVEAVSKALACARVEG